MNTITKPRDLPFLVALSWQGHGDDVQHLTDREILSRYERGWRFRGIIADLGKDEIDFIRQIAKAHDSWLQDCV